MLQKYSLLLCDLFHWKWLTLMFKRCDELPASIWPRNRSHMHKQFSLRTVQRSCLLYDTWFGTDWSFLGHLGLRLKPIASTNISQRYCHGIIGGGGLGFYFPASSCGGAADDRGTSRKEIQRDAHIPPSEQKNFTSSQGRAISLNWEKTLTGTNAKLPCSNKVNDKNRLTSHLTNGKKLLEHSS